ncbi:MAG TPA: transcriptional repressor [Candidatus Latescibacteria bacterium]|nr:transcriptional repressor [Candidatus Latescibacterota bacterium]
MRAEEKKFEKYLRLCGLRFTPERRLILREAFSIHDHFEVDDLFVRLHQKDCRISRATIYRTLDLLVKSGLLREVISGERHSHYEHILGHRHHDHLLCLKCGKVIEFSNNRIEELQKRVCEDYGFKPENHRLQIIGYCNRCQLDQGFT